MVSFFQFVKVFFICLLILCPWGNRNAYWVYPSGILISELDCACALKWPLYLLLFKSDQKSLVRWLSWLEHCPACQNVECSIPGWGTYLGCGLDPQLGHILEATNQCISHLSLPPNLSPPPSCFLFLKSINISSNKTSDQKVTESVIVHIQDLRLWEKSKIMFQLHLISHADWWLITWDFLMHRKWCSITEKTRTSRSNRLTLKPFFYLNSIYNFRQTS